MFLRCLLLLLAGSVCAKPQLTWLQTDWPPHQIVSGPFQGQGTFDLLQLQLTTAMPQFNHQNRLVSLARLEQIFQQQEPGICTVGTLYSTERAQNRLFSGPMAVGPALAIAYRAEHQMMPTLIATAGADISALALNSDLVGAYQPNRYYPDVIVQMLQHPGSNLTSQTFTSELNAAQLLSSARVDYVIEYPERMQYYNSLLHQPDKLQHSAIAGADLASISYVTCTPGRDGEAAIAAVEQALLGLWQQPEYMLAMRRWRDDAAWQRLMADITTIQRQYQNVLP